MDARFEHEYVEHKRLENRVMSYTTWEAPVHEAFPCHSQQIIFHTAPNRAVVLYNLLTYEEGVQRRTERILELQAQVQNGTYIVESMVVAECILRNETYLV
jgi:hypothetical protein